MTPRILTLDLESSPHMGWFFDIWNQNIGLSQLKDVTRVICFAAKWYGEKKVHYYGDYHHGHEQMVRAAHSLMDEADVICHFNGKRFDVPHLKREFAINELTPPSPFKQVDLLEVVRRNFKFASNKLQHVSTQLGLAGKMQHSGFNLWVECIDPDVDPDVKRKAWNLMRRYCRQDVVLTEQLYERLLPWISTHPHLGLYTGDEDCCNRCGGSDLERRGYAYTPLSKYQQFRCRDCGGWSRGKQALARVEARGVMS